MTDHTSQKSRPRALSGMRPTGKLHLGNYVGALQSWVKLQESYECFFFVADWHALTTDFDETSRLAGNAVEVVLDYLAAGLDPEKCTIFVQSHVLQHAELHVLFSMITPLSWLERVPTYKEQQQEMPNKDLHMYGFLGYPLLQAADILIYQPGFVPVGADQDVHVELTREVARRFNSLYPLGKKWSVEREAAKLTDEEKQYFIDSGRKIPETGWVQMFMQEPHPKFGRADVFPEPQTLLTPAPKLLGMDKRKMSKSYGNSILLSDEAAVVEEKIKNSVTDRPQLINKGNPNQCPVGNLHQIFSDGDRLAYITQGCTQATITCVECKALAIQSVNAHLDPIRERRRKLAAEPGKLMEVVRYGAEKATKAAEETMVQARTAVGLLQIVNISGRSEGKSAVTGRLQGGTTESSVVVKPDETTRQSIDSNSFFTLSLEELEGLDHTERGDRRRDVWLRQMRKTYALRDVGHRTFVTGKNRRIGIPTAGERVGNRWIFSIGDRTYDALVLLCHAESGEIIDFVIPRKALAGWNLFNREGKNVTFEVQQTPTGFFLRGTPGAPQNINDFKKNYSMLQ